MVQAALSCLINDSRLNDRIVLVASIDSGKQRYDVLFLDVSEDPVKGNDCNLRLWHVYLALNTFNPHNKKKQTIPQMVFKS